MYFPKWYKKGIITISDILDSEGTFLTLEELREIYSLDHINPLNYIRVKTIVTKYMTNHNREEQFHMIKPIMPINIHLINICKKGTSGYYKILEQNKCNDHKMKNKWDLDFGTKLGKETWKRTFKIVHNIISNNELKWFQMKILYRILGTRQHLVKLGIYEDGICKRCNSCEENILHLFIQCPEVSKFWRIIERHIKEKTGMTIKFDNFNVIFGHHLTDSNQIPINALIIIVKNTSMTQHYLVQI